MPIRMLVPQNQNEPDCKRSNGNHLSKGDAGKTEDHPIQTMTVADRDPANRPEIPETHGPVPLRRPEGVVPSTSGLPVTEISR